MSLFSESNAHCEVAEVLTMPRRGKLNRGLSQCERACGHGNIGSVSQCGRGGGGLSNMLLFGVRKKWELKQFGDRKIKDCANFDVANATIRVDIKF